MKLCNEFGFQTSGGGNVHETRINNKFFTQLGYNMDKVTISEAFLHNGVRCNDSEEAIYYSIFTGTSYCYHPQWATLGYVLSRRKYPGFTGKWTDSKYVNSFLKEHFGITDAR